MVALVLMLRVIVSVWLKHYISVQGLRIAQVLLLQMVLTLFIVSYIFLILAINRTTSWLHTMIVIADKDYWGEEIIHGDFLLHLMIGTIHGITTVII